MCMERVMYVKAAVATGRQGFVSSGGPLGSVMKFVLPAVSFGVLLEWR
uniref:Uncharacterized protein n=1 Tax=Aegilops tauschii subsp. strangulata TaxID=200361 RepID=A0A452ZYJ0_AEGTS